MSKQSRLIARLLRHEPELGNLVLDQNGWVQIGKLLGALRRLGFPMNSAELWMLVETNDKKRFTISDDGEWIRAAQGHTVSIDLGVEATEPPEALFHGTSRDALDNIFKLGLIAGRRQYVHLSLDADAAWIVGGRHGKPVVLRVYARKMHADGYKFYCADNGVWLIDFVPVLYLEFTGL